MHRDGGGLLTLRIFESLKPVIAAVNGAAVGIGVTMQLAMDIRLASDEARFGFVFARRGIAPEACSSWFLPRLVGIADGAGVVLHRAGCSRPPKRMRGGLVRSRARARRPVAGGAGARPRDRRQHRAGLGQPDPPDDVARPGADHPMEAHRADSRAIQARGRAGDAREGVTSFLEKRQPDYPDKVSSDMPDIWPYWVEPEFK